MRNKELFEQLVDGDIVRIWYHTFSDGKELICRLKYSNQNNCTFSVIDNLPFCSPNVKLDIQEPYMKKLFELGPIWDTDDLEMLHDLNLSYTIEGSVDEYDIAEIYNRIVNNELFDHNMQLVTSRAVYSFQITKTSRTRGIRCVGLEVNTQYRWYKDSIAFNPGTVYSLSDLRNAAPYVKGVRMIQKPKTYFTYAE